MTDHRSAAREQEVRFPDRDEHALAFDELLAGAYGAQIRLGGEPVAFAYFGQTAPGKSKGFMPSIALSSDAELPACLMRMATVARNAGRLPDAAVKQMIADLEEMLEPTE